MTTRSFRSLLGALALVTCFCALAAPAGASLGRVVAIGDSLASGMGLGQALPMVNPACGRTNGSYVERAAAKLSPSSFVDVTCNGGHSGVYEYSWTGLSAAPGNNGATIPPQYDALDGSTQAVILGTGGNEAYFGEVTKACAGLDANVTTFYQGGTNFINSCANYNYSNAGHNLLAERVANSKNLVAGVLTKIHQRSPSAKIFLVGVPRVARPSGVGCMMHGFFMSQADGPVFATWEDGLRNAMLSDVNAFNASVPGSYAHYVDIQTISGTTHTMCEPNWSDRWMNNWVPPIGVPDWGLEMHNTPTGAEVTAQAIVDSFHAAGMDTGSQATNPTNPVVSISSPANNLVTKNSSVALNFTATDNVAIASCSRTSGSSVPLDAGVNSITVSCLDHAGNSGQASVTVSRDNTPPALSISSPADGTNTTASSILLSYTASDNLGTPSCTPANGSSRPLSVGANTLSVSCTDGAGNSASASVVVNRGSVPTVAISAPANNFSTTAGAVNLAYTVGGVAAIPEGTTCTVAGSASSSASSNSVTLSPGSNAIVVVCTNQFGPSSPASVNVIGSPPSDVSITAPATGAITTAAQINVAYKVSGSSTIPEGTTCTVNAAASSSTTTNSVSLTLGSNTITVTCTGAFGAKSDVVSVTRGNPPVAAITSPTTGLSTAATSINVAFTVNGGASIPGGTTCTVGGVATASTITNSVPLSPGVNTITVVCTSQFGQGSPASVLVTRGTPPAVVISSPADGANTTSASANVAYTVGGQSSIPGGTTCAVNGSTSSSATSNPVALSLGSNSIAVICTNSFGTGNAAGVTITRGVVPVVAITAPASNTNTAASSINVAYTVDGGGAIPAGTTCTVAGAASTSTTTNSAALTIGSNAIPVACTNAFGTSTAVSVIVNRGAVPVVAISSPANNSNTTASSINLAYTVDGGASIPASTTCTVAGAASTSATSNPLSLILGANNFAVQCQNIYGPGLVATITVNRGVPPVVAIVAPADGSETTANSVNVAYTVNGGGAIPSGTSCDVGGVASSNTTTNAVNTSSLGLHTITVTCGSVFGSNSASVSVTRGNGPTVAITAPTGGLTSSASANVTFTVNAGSTIPSGVTCSVGGQATSNTGTNNVELLLDEVNVITVACSNSLGTDTKSVTLERLAPAVVTIDSPVDNLHTDAPTAEVSFTTTGSGPISCAVNGDPAEGSRIVTLHDGPNQVTVTCANRLGSATRTITIDHGPAPRVLIFAALRTDTPAQNVNATFAVDGNLDAVPNGYSCTINDLPTTTPRLNAVDLVPGQNSVRVLCSNSYGSGSATVFVNYIPPVVTPVEPEPVEPVPGKPAQPARLNVNLRGKTVFVPVRRGGLLLSKGARGGLAIKVRLDAAAKVRIKLERRARSSAKRFKSVGSEHVTLTAGSTTIRLSGRIAGRALSAGYYRATLSVPGTRLIARTKTFRIAR